MLIINGLILIDYIDFYYLYFMRAILDYIIFDTIMVEYLATIYWIY